MDKRSKSENNKPDSPRQKDRVITSDTVKPRSFVIAASVGEE